MNNLAAGYMGKSLHVNLTTKQFRILPLDEEKTSLFLGGRGLGIACLMEYFFKLQQTCKYKNSFVETDPLSEDNVIIISTSPTTGTKMPTSGRFHMNYKSPLTGIYGSTNAGGRWGVEFKKTGFDVLVITGKAAIDTYLVITSNGAEFYNAEKYNQLHSLEIREALKKEFSPKAQVLSIGLAGKNLVRFAAVMSDTGKALGRGGGGAVWGSKNLRAIVVLADPPQEINVAFPERFDAEKEDGALYHAKMKLDMGKFTKKEKMFGILASMGSLGILGMVNNYNQLIHNNMKDTNHNIKDIEKINGEALRNHARNAKSGEKKIEVKKSACYNCPIICKRSTTLLDELGRVIDRGEGPEFESTTLLGANLSIYDLTIITEANYLANKYGIDTISLGATIAAFFELYEFVQQKDGFALTMAEMEFKSDIAEFVSKYGELGFGKKELLIPLIHLIGKTEGIGRLLALGSYRFCERYGHAEFSMSVKKLELPAYDPRTSFSQALCYEMNNRGGCHLEGGYTAPHAYCAGYAEWPENRVEGTPLISKNAALKNTILDIIGGCAYGSFSLGLDEYADMVNAVTGLELNSGSLKKIAQRTLTLERFFNVLCGVSSASDWLPDRFYDEEIQIQTGLTVCDRKSFARMHQEYYQSFGWNDQGIPELETLTELDLKYFIPPDIKYE